MEAVGCQPIGKRRVLLANGREEEWPVGAVSLTLERQELPTVCLTGPKLPHLGREPASADQADLAEVAQDARVDQVRPRGGGHGVGRGGFCRLRESPAEGGLAAMERPRQPV